MSAGKLAERLLDAFDEDVILAKARYTYQTYRKRPMAISRLKELYERLKANGITVGRLWDCYAIQCPDKVKRGVLAQLADLVSLIRFEMGYADHLQLFADRVNYNSMQWTLRRNAGAVHFTEEQMEWRRLVKLCKCSVMQRSLMYDFRRIKDYY